MGRNKLFEDACIDRVGCQNMKDKKIEKETYRHSTLEKLQNVKFKRSEQERSDQLHKTLRDPRKNVRIRDGMPP
jgi:hypothetical protein